MKQPLSFFLRAKHWQLFLLLLGALFVSGSVLKAYAPQRLDSSEAFHNVTILQLAVGLPVTGGFLGWLWTLGRFLSSLVPQQLRLNDTKFQFSLIYPVIYMVLQVVAFYPWEPTPWITPLFLLAIVCLYYSLYFVAKSLRLAEMQKTVRFYQYAWPLFSLCLLFPIGIWVLQPRVNYLYDRHQIAEAVAPPVA